MPERKSTGGTRDFVYSGEEEYERDDQAKKFAEAYHNWQESSEYKRKEFVRKNKNKIIYWIIGIVLFLIVILIFLIY